jgi:hypothetical protein
MNVQDIATQNYLAQKDWPESRGLVSNATDTITSATGPVSSAREGSWGCERGHQH